jgi:hypothetical protein
MCVTLHVYTPKWRIDTIPFGARDAMLTCFGTLMLFPPFCESHPAEAPRVKTKQRNNHMFPPLPLGENSHSGKIPSHTLAPAARLLPLPLLLPASIPSSPLPLSAGSACNLAANGRIFTSTSLPRGHPPYSAQFSFRGGVSSACSASRELLPCFIA